MTERQERIRQPDYERYEREKKRIEKLPMSADEYERRVREIAKECGI